jgi:hypothetical protein
MPWLVAHQHGVHNEQCECVNVLICYIPPPVLGGTGQPGCAAVQQTTVQLRPLPPGHPHTPPHSAARVPIAAQGRMGWCTTVTRQRRCGRVVADTPALIHRKDTAVARAAQLQLLQQLLQLPHQFERCPAAVALSASALLETARRQPAAQWWWQTNACGVL